MKSVSRAVQRDAEGVPRPRGTVAGATEGWWPWDGPKNHVIQGEIIDEY